MQRLQLILERWLHQKSSPPPCCVCKQLNPQACVQVRDRIRESAASLHARPGLVSPAFTPLKSSKMDHDPDRDLS